MIGIIPAGGRSTRFGGIYKDALPLGEETFLITEACQRALSMGATDLVIVTSAEKAAMHEHILVSKGIHACLVVSSDQGLWGAIRETFLFHSDSLLILADTVFTPPESPIYAGFTFGVFATDEPERFSIIANDTIITKSPDLHGQYLAWGCVYWSECVVRFWQNMERLDGPYAHYDDALRAAMKHYKYTTFVIDDYHDLGSWEAYRTFLLSRGG